MKEQDTQSHVKNCSHFYPKQISALDFLLHLQGSIFLYTSFQLKDIQFVLVLKILVILALAISIVPLTFQLSFSVQKLELLCPRTDCELVFFIAMYSVSTFIYVGITLFFM